MTHIAIPRLRAVALGLLFPLLALPNAAVADGCTPMTSTASPVTNATVTCTGMTLNQNLNAGYGTFNETGNMIDVQTMASVTGDTFGFALADGNTVNNSGAVTGGTTGINTTSGSTITVNNLTAASTISGTAGEGLNVTNVVLSNAGTISGSSDGIIAVGNVTLSSNTGSIIGTMPDAEGIFANGSVSGSNAGTISGVVGIDTSFGNGVNLSSNSGNIQANGGFAINANGDVVIGTNSGSIVSDGLGTGFARAINAGGSVTVTNTSTGSITATDALGGFGDAIVAVGDTTVVNSGNITGEDKAIDTQFNSSTSLNLTNNFGGTISAGNDAVEAIGGAMVANAGTISSQNGNGVFVSDASITNTSTGIIETTGTDAEAVIAGSLLLNNAGIIRTTASQFFAVDVTTIATGSINSGTISGNLAAINADDSIDMLNTGTITGGILAIQATNTITFNNMGTGTVSGDRAGIVTVAGDVEIMNSGTIAATGGSGLQAIAILSLTGNITNTATGIISATGTGVNNDAINTADATTVDNFVMISSTGRTGVRAGSNATIINEAGGTITGVTGIVIRDSGIGLGAPVNGSVFNAGTITGTGGTAINFAFTAGAGPMTLTLAPGSVINGLVLGTGADTFQLGGSGIATFNVSDIGATQQYQGFTSFNKIGTSDWTLTGSGNQAWHIFAGTLIGTTNTFAADIINDAHIEFTQGFDGAYANVISGAGDFLKGGTGAVTLTGANTYTGTTTISAGTLALSGAGGIANSSNVSVHATFDISGASGGVSIQALDGDGGVLLGGNSLTLSNANGLFSGTISGTGGLVLNSGIETLGGDNTYSGGTTINSGTLTIGVGAGGSIVGDVVDNGALVFNRLGDLVFSGAISGTGELVTLGPGALTLSGSYSYSGQTIISTPVGISTLVLAGGTNTLSGDIIFDRGALITDATSLTLSGAIEGDGSLSVEGGTTTLSGNNSFGGGTTVANATLSISSGNNLGGGLLFLENGSTLLLTSSFTLAHAISVAGDTTFDVTGSNAVFVTAPITDGAQPGDLVKTDSGTLVLEAPNTYTGGTFVNGGTLQLGLIGNLSGVTGPISVSGATLNVVNADFSQVTSLALNAGTAQFGQSSSAGNTPISAGNGSTLVFAQSATAANAPIRVNGAGVQITFEQNSTASQSTITFNQPGLLAFTDMASADHAHIVTVASAAVDFASSSTAANALVDASAGGDIFFANNASAAQAMITLGANSTLNFSNNANGGSASVTTAPGSEVFLAGLTNGGTTIASINGAGSVVLGANILTIGSDNSDSAISGGISGTGGLTKQGVGTLTLSADNTYTGVTTIAGGTLQIGNGGAAGSIVGDVVDNAALVFDLSGSATIPGAISGSGSLTQIGRGTTVLAGNDTYTGGTTISNGGLQIGNAGTTGSIIGDVLDNGTLTFARSDIVTFPGAISGSGNLAQAGGGTLILTGTNTYTGGTTINSGALHIGSGGATGSIVGDIVDNATLAFDRSDSVTFSGAISGTGALTQIGGGTTILSGGNTYSGGTTITSGTLQIGSGGTSGSLAGDVTNDATLAFDRSDNVTFAGVISGAGNLIQNGTATLILTGANTFTGGTTIASGALQLGNGGTTGSITGDVIDNGTLTFDRADGLTFPGAISGNGAVVQNGRGTLILTGTSSYTGATLVNAGILDVNGSIANSAVTVFATLKGNGTVGPLTLQTGGTVAPGNSIGTLHVAGSLSFAAGSTYGVELNPAGQSDLIAATGAATIASGALVQITAASGTYPAKATYVILTAVGGVTGTFDTPTINLPFLSPQLITLPNEVDLVLTLRDINLIPPAHTPNQIATAVAVRAGGAQSVIFDQFLQDSQNGLGFVTDALDQLSGEIYPSLETEELEDNRLVQLSILGRLRQASTGDASGTLAPDTLQPREIDGVFFWTQTFADWGTFDSDGNVATLDQNLSGILFGIDTKIGAGDIGIAGGYSHSHANQRNSSAKGGNAHIAAYGGWVDGAMALRFGGTYGWGNRDIFRAVVFPGFAETLTSREDEHASQVFGEVAFAEDLERLALEPFAGLSWLDASTGSFAERGGAAALFGRGGDASVAYSSLGIRFAGHPFGTESLVITPHASVVWQHAFGGLHPGQVVTFEDTEKSFFILGSLIDSDSADVALGIEAKVGAGGTLSLGYEGILSSRVRLNTIHAGLNWAFQ